MKKSTMARLVAGVGIAGLTLLGALPASAAEVGSTKLAFVGDFFTWSSASPDGSQTLLVDESAPGLWLFDVASNSLTAISDPNSDISDPGQVAWSSDGSTIYATDYNSNDLLIVDVASAAVVDSVSFVGGGPYSIAIAPDDSELYIGLYRSNEIAVYDLGTDTVTATIAGTGDPYAMFVTPDGATAYSMDYYGDIAVFDTATQTSSFTWSNVAGGFYQGCTDSSVTTLYMPDQDTQTVFAVDLSDGSIIAQTTIPDASTLFGCAVSPDDLSVFVTDDDTGQTDGSDYSIITVPGVVTELTAADLTIVDSYDMDGLAYTTAITFVDDCTAYVNGYYGNSQDIVYGLGCTSPTPELPNTGVDTAPLALAGGVALVVLAAGSVLVLRRRVS